MPRSAGRLARSDSAANGLAIVREVLGAILDGRPLEDTFGLIAQRMAEMAGFDFCGVLLPDSDGRRIHVAGAYNFPADYEELVDSIFRVPYEDVAGSPTSIALRELRTLVLRDSRTEAWYGPWRDLAEQYGFRSLVSVPLITEGTAVGVLNGYSSTPREPDAEELVAMETLARQAALALRLTLLVDNQHATIAQLRDSNEQLERQREVLERAHEIHLRLTEAVVAGADTQSVAEIVARLIGRAIAVVDTRGALICASPSDDETAISSLLGTTVGDGAPIASARARPCSAGMITVQVHIGAERLGEVRAAEGEPASRDLDMRALEHAATVLAVIVARERVARATEERLHSDFLFDLLNGRDTTERLRERAVHYGLGLDAEHRVLVVTLRSDDLGGQVPDWQRLLRTIRDTLRERLVGTVHSQLGNSFTAVMPTGPAGKSLEAPRALVAECRRRVQAIAPAITLSAGIGSAATGMDGLRTSAGEAQRCVDALERLGRHGETIAMDELGLLGLFLDTDRPDRLAAFGQDLLRPVLEHDRQASGALLATLDAYLRHDCNLSACAEELFVHPNTIKYRLRRIEELCGIDLHKPEELLQATLARMCLRLLAAPAPDAPPASTRSNAALGIRGATPSR